MMNLLRGGNIVQGPQGSSTNDNYLVELQCFCSIFMIVFFFPHLVCSCRNKLLPINKRNLESLPSQTLEVM